MRNILLFIPFLFVLFSCQNEDDSTNEIYKNRYERRFIIFQDSLGTTIRDSGVVRVSQKDNIFKFDFEVASGTVKPIENIRMEITGNNTLRNLEWTPSKLITLSKDSINISYREGASYWFVNGISSF
ncbi:hypothetical protein SAMN05443634_10954 [Chishuiella changwenlii]|uniref:Lipoprotein n=1 Tax=Chishuiella changwenlii TaxID=1434701 RepID=A0A1M7AIZ3_9FLAO|nr:hypothetical protein [Chishuiella changwenlii]GGE90452.1 hypothetical protein GCM10010984_05220 [Chishuiella changwenlii]SHL42724.1 hypothetical protein SAMN05443634_10954 [Chishuiella changwenlii]